MEVRRSEARSQYEPGSGEEDRSFGERAEKLKTES
jgi:hypothetical protein